MKNIKSNKRLKLVFPVNFKTFSEKSEMSLIAKLFWEITNFHHIFEESKFEIAFFTGHLLQII
jgi:hypothetical protein